MKTLLIILFSLVLTTTQPSYCDGWEEGYKEGWCYNQIANCLDPITPNCPIPVMYKEEWSDGYNRGFVKGKKDFEKSR